MRITDFKGRLPIIATDKLPANVATVATNCDMQTEQVRPIKGPTLVQSIAKPGDIRTIWKVGDTWIGFTDTVSFAKAPSDNDRVYYLGDGYAKHTDADLVDAGGIPAAYPSVAYRMGVTPPAAAPTLAVTGTAGGEIGECSYVYTIVNRISSTYEEESAPSPPTAPRMVYEGETITVQALVAPTDGGYNDTYFRVYRSTDGSGYMCVPTGRDGNGDFLYDLDTGTTSLDDNDTVTGNIYIDLVVTLSTKGWDRLPDDAKCLTEYQNGIFVALYGKKLLPSVLFVPYAFPQGINDPGTDFSYIEFQYDPYTHASFNGILIVGTSGNPYAVSGSDPENLQMQKIPYEYACVGDMCVTEIGVFYPSPDGLVFCDGLTAKPWTKDVFTKDQWTALGPTNLKMFYHDDKLICFFKGSPTGFICDFKNQKTITDFDIEYDFWDGHMVAEEDTLNLLLQNGVVYYIYSWATGTEMDMFYSGRWKESLSPCYTAARIEGDFTGDKTLDLTITADGVSTTVEGIGSDDAFYLGTSGWASEYTYSVTGDAYLTAIRFGSYPGELHGD